jgi:hypothetical protein
MEKTLEGEQITETDPRKKYSIWDLEEMLKSGKEPPGIEQFQDVPDPENKEESTKSQIPRIKKVLYTNKEDIALGNR